MTEWTGDDTLTSVEAAELLGVNRTTTQRAASGGLVPGARPEPRPGTINAPWVATRAAWQAWYDTRRPAGRPPKKEDSDVEIQDLGDGWAALIGPYRNQVTGAHMGSQVLDRCQRTEIARDAGTARQTIWASDFVHADSRWDATAINRMGQPGAVIETRPSVKKMTEALADLLPKAQAAWERAQDRIWVIAVEHRLTGMVKTPVRRFVAADAATHGLLLKPLPDEDEAIARQIWVDECILSEAWIQFGLPEWDDYRSGVQRLLIELVETRTYAIQKQIGVQMTAIGFAQYVRRARTYEKFQPLAMQALRWLQGETEEYPPGVETGEEYRRKYWGPNSPYDRI